MLAAYDGVDRKRDGGQRSGAFQTREKQTQRGKGGISKPTREKSQENRERREVLSCALLFPGSKE
jgi:hypothetical protein